MAPEKRTEGCETGELSKTARLLGLFTAVLLVAAPGCGLTDDSQAKHVHVDRNGDGYCDDDGEPVGQPESRPGGGLYYLPGGYYSAPRGPGIAGTPAPGGHNATISGGSAPKGGIGGLGTGGGG
ncbi:MAG TPA: hypothetical protein PKA10_16115 [Selenomonadales bacterium]|nr:hypothetical protein [Selenomonadales bacterium]